jgi:hypothetical protein
MQTDDHDPLIATVPDDAAKTVMVCCMLGAVALICLVIWQIVDVF